MDQRLWSRRVSDDEAARRAGGRRRYNRARQEAALLRRLALAFALTAPAALPSRLGWRRFRTAFLLRHGISRATFYRDLQAVVHAGLAAPLVCPACQREAPTPWPGPRPGVSSPRITPPVGPRPATPPQREIAPPPCSGCGIGHRPRAH